MSTVDRLIIEEFVPFRQKIIDTIRTEHPYLLSVLDKIIADKKNRIGLQVTENGNIVGEFTFHLNGVDIEKTEPGSLSPELHHPFLGVIKPYVVVEKTALESIIQDQGFSDKPLFTFGKHLPSITFKFKQ